MLWSMVRLTVYEGCKNLYYDGDELDMNEQKVINSLLPVTPSLSMFAFDRIVPHQPTFQTLNDLLHAKSEFLNA